MAASLKKLVQAAKKDEGKTVLPIINRHLTGRNFVKEEIEEWVHPSGIGVFDDLCARQIFLSLFTPVEKYPPGLLVKDFPARTHRIFDNGTSVHLRWQWYCIESGLCDPRKGVGWEIPIEYKAVGMRGHADVLVWPQGADENIRRMHGIVSGHGDVCWPIVSNDGFTQQPSKLFKPFKRIGEPAVVEIKSMYSAAWQVLCEPLYHHRLQAMCYVASLRRQYPTLDTVYFLYENKDNQKVKEFEYIFNRKLWGQYETILRKVQKSREDKSLPQRICRSAMTERAIICDHVKTCFSHSTFKQLVQIEDGKTSKKK